MIRLMPIILTLLAFYLPVNAQVEADMKLCGLTNSEFASAQVDNFSDQQLKTLLGYRESNYMEINRFLRGLDISYLPDDRKAEARVREQIRILDEAFIRTPGIPCNLRVFRGVIFLKDMHIPQVGEVYLDLGYLSTSAHESTAKFFAEKSVIGASEFTRIIFKIDLPSGFKAIYMNVTSFRSDVHVREQEITIPRAVSFYIVQSERQGDVTYITLKPK